MRKIKITALLLAVLMIVTAFAGCASKSTVTNLDNKVNDLDASIEEQKTALSGIESTLATISKALENQGSSDNLDEVIKDVEENEKNVADLTDAIKDLQAAIDDLKKPAAETPTTPVTGDLETAIYQLSAKLEALVGVVEDDKGNYTAETLAAIRELAGEAETAIENAKDKAAAEAAYKAFEAKLSEKAYMSVNGKLYAYVLELKGNITEDSAELVEEALEALEEAEEFYKDKYDFTDATQTALYNKDYEENMKEYSIGVKETIDLPAAILKLADAQTITLPRIIREADVLEKKIDELDATVDFETVTALLADYKDWAREAKELSPVNVKYVENYDVLDGWHKFALNSGVATLIFKAGKIESALSDGFYTTLDDNFGTVQGVFYDYQQLLSIGEQVLFVFKTDVEDADGNVDDKYELTSKIYDTIDAWIADWAKEYELSEIAIEAIIDTQMNEDGFYAKYNSNKALAKAFEAESKTLSEGIFKNIKALNSKRLSSDAMDVLNTYKKNAEDINAWRDALIKAYIAELDAIDNENETRTIDTKGEYKAELEKNFNLMVETAKLCEYNKATDSYAPYGLGFLEKLDDNDNGNAYYHKLYDFQKYTEMGAFLTTTFAEADKAAKLINGMIENYDTSKADSIKGLATAIGGYVAFDNINNKLIALNEVDIKNGAVTAVDTIAEFIYTYKTNAKYDLSDMIKVDLYNEKLATVEERIKKADETLAKLDSAYGLFLEDGGLVTLSKASSIKGLYALLTAWVGAGNSNMEIAVEIDPANNGVKQYKLVKLVTRYSNITPADLSLTAVKNTDKDTGPAASAIVIANERATWLQREADLAVSAYKMMDAVNAFGGSNAFSFDNLASTTVAKGVETGKDRHHLGSHGVVSVTCGPEMTEKGTDAKGRTYDKGMSLWTVEYVVLKSTGSTGATTFGTKKLEGYFYSNYEDAKAANNYLADAKDAATGGQTIAEVLAGELYRANVTGLSTYVQELLFDIPNFVKTTDIEAMAPLFDNAAEQKLIPNHQLPAFAMSLEARFRVNNYNEEYKALDDAKAKFNPELGGYGLNYVKALSYMMLDNDNTTSVEEYKSIIKAADKISTLKDAVNDTLTHMGGTCGTIAFGVADMTWLSDRFNEEVVKYGDGVVTITEIDPATGNPVDKDVYLDEFDLEAEDFDVDGIVIYLNCPHTSLVPTCVGHATTCPDCGVSVPGTLTTHTAPAGVDYCKGYKCEVCGDNVAPVHDVAVTLKTFLKDDITNTYYSLIYTYKCNDCADFTKDVMIDIADVTFVDPDTVEFDVVIDGVDYGTFTFVKSGTTWVAAPVAP